MSIGEVKVADDQDFFYLKYLLEGEPGWSLEFNKDNTKVWTKPVTTTNFKMVKVNAIFLDVDPEVLYDVLHDPEYRKVWDSHMIEQYDIGALNPNNDLGYYAMTCPSPVSKRDFVLQRSWLDTGQEKYIINHSVYHRNYPPRKDFVRAKSFITGFLVRSGPAQGSILDYVSQSDPCGKLPSVLVNKLTQKVARKMVATLEVACKGYPQWKSVHNPHWKPWHNPEQMTKPRVCLEDCRPSQSDLLAQGEAGDNATSSQKGAGNAVTLVALRMFSNAGKPNGLSLVRYSCGTNHSSSAFPPPRTYQSATNLTASPALQKGKEYEKFRLLSTSGARHLGFG